MPPPVSVSHAIELAAHYLESVCDEDGKFTYQVDPISGKVSPTYNILRHAGAIYSLAMYNHVHPERKAVDTMIRAARFMRTHYIGPDEASGGLAVWSQALPEKSAAELGAGGLALIAFTALDQAEPYTVPLADLRGLARFVLFMQKSDGSFTSKYDPDTGLDPDFNSLYYPGEASLGLISLYEMDHNKAWLTAVGDGLFHLAQSRVNNLLCRRAEIGFSEGSGCTRRKDDQMCMCSKRAMQRGAFTARPEWLTQIEIHSARN